MASATGAAPPQASFGKIPGAYIKNPDVCIDYSETSGADAPTREPENPRRPLSTTGLGARFRRPPWAEPGSEPSGSCSLSGPSGPSPEPSVSANASREPSGSRPGPHGPNNPSPAGPSVPSLRASAPLAVEICCGCANLSFHLQQLGFSVHPVDWKGNRFTPKVLQEDIDLTVPSGQSRLWSVLSSPRLAYVHMSPPCGTASRARERPLSAAARAKGIPEPKPLRSEDFPLGLPNLARDFPQEVTRVRKANTIYQLCADVAEYCVHRAVPFTIDNPANSLFWFVPCIGNLLSHASVGDVLYQACMHGSSRDKRSRLRSFPEPSFRPLAAQCDRSHVHKPWGLSQSGFATREEAEFPDLLCSRMSHMALSAVHFVSEDPGQGNAASSMNICMPAVRRSTSSAESAFKPRETALPATKKFFDFQKSEKSKMTTGSMNEGSSTSPSCKPSEGHHHASSSTTPALTAPALSSTTTTLTRVHAHVPTTAIAPSRQVDAHFSTDRRALQRVAAGVQPRGAVGFSVVPEYKYHISLPIPPSYSGDPHKLLNEELCAWDGHTYPKGSKVISVQTLKGVAGSRDGDAPLPDEEAPAPLFPGKPNMLVLGVAWTTEEFVSQSVTLPHPFDCVEADDDILVSVFRTLTSPVEDTKLLREATLAHWRSRAEELETKEEELRCAAHPDVLPSIRGKRLLLFGEMLRASNFPSASALVHRMSTGFPLLGNIEPTGVFPTGVSSAGSCIEDLWTSARTLQNSAIGSIGPSSDAELDCAVSDATREEVERGWLLGPFSRADLDSRLGLWVPARRFGIRQGTGTRVIDDYSEHGQNACTATQEKIDVGGVDVVAGIARAILASLSADSRWVRVVLSTGAVLEGWLHEEWSVSAAKTLVGKLWDLSKAYRQLARSPAHASVSVVVTYNSHKKCVELYEQPVLPFGAKASVWDFNWVARGLWRVFVSQFGLFCTHYFDDFPVLEFDALSGHTQKLVDDLLELLGWSTKTQHEFSATFDVLGVVCDLTAAQTDRVRFTNKAKRIDELQTDVDRIISAGFLRSGEARSLRGRFTFARGQTFGRCGAVALKCLGEVADGTKALPTLDARTAGALRWLLAMLRVLRPRELRAHPLPPLLLYVDGACEPAGDGIEVSIGAVLMDPSRPDYGPKFFGTKVGPEVVGLWSLDGKKQLIGQAELLPVLLAKTTWSAEFTDRPCICFIDNDSARYSLIKGYSPILDSSRIINETWMKDAELGIASWYARVPTCCNIADDPSRLDFTVLRNMYKSREYTVSVPDDWGSSTDLWGTVAARLSRDL